MPKVNVQVIGGAIKQIEANTVGDVKTAMDAGKYTATVNGEPAEDSYVLSDYEFVALAPQVKGA